VFSYLCVVVRCRVEGGLQQHSCEVELSWNASAGLEVLEVHTWNNDLILWPSVYENHHFCNRKVTTTYPAEGLTLNFFFQKEFGQCHSNGYNFMRFIMVGSHVIPSGDPWRKTFTLQARNGTARLNTHLSAHFCVIQFGFMETNKHILLNTLKHQWFCSQSKLTTEQIADILY
jgi:hypothetical protein